MVVAGWDSAAFFVAVGVGHHLRGGASAAAVVHPASGLVRLGVVAAAVRKDAAVAVVQKASVVVVGVFAAAVAFAGRSVFVPGLGRLSGRAAG